jgi:hypothetical protein
MVDDDNCDDSSCQHYLYYMSQSGTQLGFIRSQHEGRVRAVSRQSQAAPSVSLKFSLMPDRLCALAAWSASGVSLGRRPGVCGMAPGRGALVLADPPAHQGPRHDGLGL